MMRSSVYPNEEACRTAWFAWRWPEGFKCPRCAGAAYSEIRGRQLLQCRRCRYQVSLIAGTVLQGTKLPMRVWFRAMHLLAQGKKSLSNIELGRRLGISTNAAWRMQHKLMQAMLERNRHYKLGAAGPRIEIDDAYIGGERTGEGTGLGRRGHTPFIIAVETTSDGRPLHTRLQVVRGFQTVETKRLCTNVEAGATIVSDGGQWFRCIAEQPGIVHERHVTGTDRASPPPCLPLGEHHARQHQEQPPRHAPRRRRQASAALPRRLRLALQSPFCPEDDPSAPRRRRSDNPAHALSPP